jgi:outer membrane lipoprotein-sorting protein
VSADAAGSKTPILLMAGAHAMRYWYGGPDRQRVALTDTDSESDVFYTGTNVWQWNSATNVATRSTLPSRAAGAVGSPVFPAPLTFAALTPEQLTTRALAAVDAQTTVTVSSGPEVADHPTYQLVLRPGEQDATRIAAVRIDVDASHDVPLGVQVYARGERAPSIDVSFSSITYRMPDAQYFRFTPPPGATVRRGVQPQLVSANGRVHVDAAANVASPEPAGAGPASAVPVDGEIAVETGWSAITAFRLTRGVSDDTATDSSPAGSLRSAMRPVSGAWGSGYLLDTPLLCVLITADGRVLSGSVEPAELYAAAS